MTRWEYQTVKLKVAGFFGGKIEEAEVDTLLNAAGRDGWELAATESVSVAQGATSCVLLMFKRPSH